ncbi:MAG: LON peptidase substrate-binding domain-containing protein, partial [Bacteroidia bacterium]
MSENTFLTGFKNIIDEDTEFIPLMSPEDEEAMNTEEVPGELPILPLRNTVLFPGVVIPITVGRDKSIKLIKDAYKTNKIIGVVAQKDVSIEDPELDELHKIGTVANILKMLRMPDGNTTVIIQGKRRFSIKELTQTDPYFKANVETYPESKIPKDKEFGALVGSLKDLALQIIQQSPNIPSEAAFAIKNIESPAFLINFISSNMNLEVEKKQELLEVLDLNERATKVLAYLTQELQLIELKNQIQSKVKVDLDKQQREYFLNQQLKTIQEELGGSASDQEIKSLKDRGAKKKWTAEVQKAFNKEVERLTRMNPAAAEYSVTVNYLDLLLELPWGEMTKDNFDLKRAQKVLDEDHYGLDKVKSRIM